MRNTVDLLAGYAQYHRDRRNISTHMIGVPLIVLAVAMLLSRPSVGIGGLVMTPAWAVLVPMTLWYLTRGDLVLGAVVSGAIAVLVTLAQELVGQASVGGWLGWGLGLFALGWAIQFIGHYYEGRKPAFVDDLAGLLVGPMFVTAEALFSLGWGRALLAEIERRAGPTHFRDLASPA
jgi:uncharacterized membrane protein YGL010W